MSNLGAPNGITDDPMYDWMEKPGAFDLPLPSQASAERARTSRRFALLVSADVAMAIAAVTGGYKIAITETHHHERPASVTERKEHCVTVFLWLRHEMTALEKIHAEITDIPINVRLLDEERRQAIRLFNARREKVLRILQSHPDVQERGTLPSLPPPIPEPKATPHATDDQNLLATSALPYTLERV